MHGHEPGSGTTAPEACHAAAEASAASGSAGGRIDWSLHRALRRRGFAWAGAAGAGLLLVYVVTLALLNSLEHVLGEFLLLWPWMTALVLGFAAQVGLFAYARGATRGTGATRAGGVLASGGASTLSMVACCAHHVTDVLPLIGLAGAAVFLASYQSLFLLLGVLSNVVGLVYVLGLIRRHGLYPDRRSALSIAVGWPVDRAVPSALVGSALVLLVAILRAVT